LVALTLAAIQCQVSATNLLPAELALRALILVVLYVFQIDSWPVFGLVVNSN